MARLDCDKDTDFFMLKFLLCNENTESEKHTNIATISPNIEQEERKRMMQMAKKQQEQMVDNSAIVVSENDAVKKYAMTSYMKILTQRVVR